MFFPRPKTQKVSNGGARAGSVLRGCSRSNQGLRLQIMQDQPRGHDGAIRGQFLIFDAGDNIHSDSLLSLAHRATDAAEVLAIIRQERPGCVNIVNANILVQEKAEVAS